MDMGNEHRHLKRKKMSSGVFIPPETIPGILSRLPVKSLLRFRTVCKSWCALISEPYFSSSQLQQAKQNPVFIIMPDKGCSDPWSKLYAYKEGDERPNFLVGCQFPCDGPLVMYPSTCNGLVLFYSATRMHLLNPSTRKLTTLPEGSPNRFDKQHVGFGFDSSTKKYKVVRVFHRSPSIGMGFFDVGCEIFELGSHAWRAAGDPPYPVGHTSPSFFDGVLYWVTSDARKRISADILSFDLRSEEFGVITGPPCRCEATQATLILPIAKSGGNLCLGIWSEGSRSLDVWVSKRSSSRDLWVKESSICIEHPGKLCPRGFYNGKVLLFWRKGLCYFSMTSKRIEEVFATIRNSGDDNSRENASKRVGFQLGIYEGSLVPVE